MQMEVVEFQIETGRLQLHRGKMKCSSSSLLWTLLGIGGSHSQIGGSGMGLSHKVLCLSTSGVGARNTVGGRWGAGAGNGEGWGWCLGFVTFGAGGGGKKINDLKHQLGFSPHGTFSVFNSDMQQLLRSAPHNSTASLYSHLPLDR